MFPDWRGDALIGALKGQALVRLDLEGSNVVGEARIRDADIVSRGAIMVLTDSENGALQRLSTAD